MGVAHTVGSVSNKIMANKLNFYKICSSICRIKDSDKEYCSMKNHTIKVAFLAVYRKRTGKIPSIIKTQFMDSLIDENDTHIPSLSP